MLPTDLNELLTRGVAFYKDRDYEKAVEHLLPVVDEDKSNWRARLYLAMSLFRVQRFFMANAQFRAIIDSCPDAEIKARAEAALLAMQSETKSMPKMTTETSIEKWSDVVQRQQKHE